MKKINRKIGAYIIIMLIVVIVISSSISSLELNKNFVETKNKVNSIEEHSVVYASVGPGFIWLKGYGSLDLATGVYDINLTVGGFWAGLRFFAFGSGGPPIAPCHKSPTYYFTTGQFDPAGLTTFMWLTGGVATDVHIIGYVNSAFTITGESLP
jgi:hypothetical protein